MDMAVDDARHNESPSEVSDRPLIFRKPGLITYIDEFPVLHRNGRCLRMLAVRCENVRVFNNLICLHCDSFLKPVLIQDWSFDRSLCFVDPRIMGQSHDLINCIKYDQI